MKTSTTPTLTASQIVDRDTFVEKVRQIVSLQYAGRVAEAQKVHQWLMGWSESKNVDFAKNFDGAVRYLRKTACGVHDSAAYAAA